MNATRFPDRRAAGRQLALALQEHAGRPGLLILALPRGGVPVGFELARALGAPLDVLLVRKLGVPGHEELGFGALASGGARIVSEAVVRDAGIDPPTIERVTQRERRELERRDRVYRGGRPRRPLQGQAVILVDDGLATGSTMRVAIEAARAERPERIVVAVPVAPQDTCRELRSLADQVVCLITPPWFEAVGLWYDDFRPTTDEEVRELLAVAEERAMRAGG